MIVVHQAKHFGIDLLCQAIMSNHIHLVLRSTPDVVKEWDNTEVARQVRSDKRGATPQHMAPLFDRLGVSSDIWCHLVKNFGKLFSVVAGKPNQFDGHRSKTGSHKYRARRAVRELLSSV